MKDTPLFLMAASLLFACTKAASPSASENGGAAGFQNDGEGGTAGTKAGTGGSGHAGGEGSPSVAARGDDTGAGKDAGPSGLPTDARMTSTNHDAATNDAKAVVDDAATAMTPGTRDVLKWPFAQSSIWNMPLGDGAVYVNGGIAHATSWGMTVDEDVVVMRPTAPLVTVAYSDAGWSGRSRCAATGNALYQVPLPAGFILSGGGQGDTPNYAAAILLADGHTIKQPQPLARCQAGGIATTLVTYPDADIMGDGIAGAHGGSAMSSLGGTIRMAELVKGAPPIRHALKINLYEQLNISSAMTGHRWPAATADGCAPGCYKGSNPALRMGALLALRPDFDISAAQLKTEPARALAWTLQNYGAYLVDSTGWNVYAVEVELGPDGSVVDEFKTSWGFDIAPQGLTDPFAVDMDTIFRALAVIDNNGPQSVGGGGKPRQPLAPPFKAP